MYGMEQRVLIEILESKPNAWHSRAEAVARELNVAGVEKLFHDFFRRAARAAQREITVR
jgi:hypothetical protein